MTTKKPKAADEPAGAAGAADPGTDITVIKTWENNPPLSKPWAIEATKAEGAMPTTEAGEVPPSGGEVQAMFNAEELAADPLAGGEFKAAPLGNDFEVTHRGSDFEVTHLHVRAVTDGFRRAGRAWPAAGVEVPVEEFTGPQLEALCTEPQLVVTPIAFPAAE